MATPERARERKPKHSLANRKRSAALPPRLTLGKVSEVERFSPVLLKRFTLLGDRLMFSQIYNSFTRQCCVRLNTPPLLRLLILILLITVFPALARNSVYAQSEKCTEPQTASQTLSSGAQVQQTMGRNQRHVFRLSLQPEEFARVIVEQRGSDLLVRVLDSNRNEILRRDSPNSKFGPEAVSVVAETEENYYIEVCPNGSQPIATYDLKVESLRTASASDKSRVAAERLMMEAQKLLDKRESLKDAIDQFSKAIETWKTIGDVREEGYALCSIGDAHRLLRKFQEAMKYFTLALSSLEQAQDFSGQAYVFNQIGAAHRDLEDPLNALPYYARALELRRRIGDRWGEAHIHNNVGFLYSAIGDQQASISNLKLALPIWRDLNDQRMELIALNNIAKANVDLSNLTESFQQLQTILDACEKSNELCFLEPFARNSYGIILDIWGEPDEALNQYERALKLFRAANNKKDEATVFDDMGMVFAGIGDTSTAVDHFHEALKIRQNELDHRGEEVTRSNLGYVEMLKPAPNYAEALKQLEQARQFSQLSRNRRFEAYTLTRIGMVHVATRKMDQALSDYKAALEMQEQIGDIRGQAITLDKIAELYSLMAQPELALKAYEQALERWTTIGDRQGEALSLYGMARVERSQDKLLEARDRIVKAIEKLESLRTRMTSHRLRLDYFAARYDYYELEIDLRMRLYEITQSQTELELALLASERARARNLLDFLTESRANIRQGVDPQLLARERTQRHELADKLAALQTLLSRKHSDDDRISMERELQSRTRLLDQTRAEIRRRSPRYAALSQPQPLRLKELQQLLDRDTVLLEYAIGEERSYLWLITPTQVQPFTLPGRARIEQAVDNFLESIRAQEPPTSSQVDDRLAYTAKLRRAAADYSKHALRLSRIVLGPVFSALKNQRLVIVADGPLQYVPFAALPIPRNARSSNTATLITRHEIVYQPSASALALIRQTSRPPATKALAVFADPVFDSTDERVRNGSTGSQKEAATIQGSRELKVALRDAGDIGSEGGALRLVRLQYSRKEADGIVGTAQPGSFLKATDFEASRSNFLSQDFKHFRILHLATHGILNTRHPELSGLVFSLVDERGKPEDGFLRAGDVYNLDLPIEMVVLSACQTGIGRRVKGEGLIGLTRGFMHAGAARVVASLWKVDDEATAELMKRFYANMLQQKLPAATALRRAQLELMQTQRSPYYWAGFVLQGDWK